MADLCAVRDLVSGPLLRTGRARGLVKQILKFRFCFLVTSGVHVREVVRDHVEVHLLGLHPGGGRIKSA